MYLKRSISFLLAIGFLGFACLDAAKAAPVAPTYGFSLVPKQLVFQKNHTAIILSLVLLPQFNLPGVELQGSMIDGKTRLTYSKPFKKFIKSLKLTKSDFMPFETYLKGQLTSAEVNPDPYIIILDNYLKTGAAPSFTIDLSNK